MNSKWEYAIRGNMRPLYKDLDLMMQAGIDSNVKINDAWETLLVGHMALLGFDNDQIREALEDRSIYRFQPVETWKWFGDFDSLYEAFFLMEGRGATHQQIADKLAKEVVIFAGVS